MRPIPPHEPEAGCISAEDLQAELAMLERVEHAGRAPGRAYLRIPDDWIQDPRIGPAELRDDVATLERLGSAA